MSPSPRAQASSSPSGWAAVRAATAGGLPGAAAASMQTLSFMWLSTTIALQHRSGLSAAAALRALYLQGGVRRLYAGVAPTVAYSSLARFGDTAANAGVLHVLDHRSDLHVGLKTVCASAVAAAWRGALLPLEACKQNMQVRGRGPGLRVLVEKTRSVGLRGLWHGSLASCSSAFMSHLPLFLTVNSMEASFPANMHSDNLTALQRFARNGGMGFCATFVADCVNNGFRVVATVQQTSRGLVPVNFVVDDIIQRDGLRGLLARGLRTRLFSSALQGACFVAIWKELEKRFPRQSS